MGGQEFLLDAADGQHLAAQRDFARHGDVAAHRILCQRAHDGRADGDAGGRSVLGDGAFRNMHVNVDRAVEIPGQAEQIGARPDVTHRRLRGLLHHVSELAGERKAALAFHKCGFRSQHGASHFGPRQAGGQANFVVILEPEFAVLQHAQEFIGVGGRDFHI